MTDTTAPDAITQADDIVTIDEIRAIFSSGTVPMEAAVAIQNATSRAALRAELREIAAAHRRLAAHGAGEGLREALTSAREWIVDRADKDEYPDDWDIVRLIDRALTPPTDAGSTTREGGEGLEICWSCDGSGEGVADTACNICDGWGGVATTSSPNDSPDSGEAKQIIRQLRETGPKNFHNGTEWVGKPHNRDGEAAAQLIERLLAASPASLSGGAEALTAFDLWWSTQEPGARGGEWVKRLGFVAGWNAFEQHAAAIAQKTYNRAYRDGCEDSSAEPDMELARDGWHDWLQDCEALKSPAAPSPEAPANRQEAGEVEVRPFAEWHEDRGSVLWWRLPIQEPPYVGTPLDLGRAMKVVVQVGVEEHDLPATMTGGWPFDEDDETQLFWTALPDAGAIESLATLTSPKDVKGGEA